VPIVERRAAIELFSARPTAAAGFRLQLFRVEHAAFQQIKRGLAATFSRLSLASDSLSVTTSRSPRPGPQAKGNAAPETWPRIAVVASSSSALCKDSISRQHLRFGEAGPLADALGLGLHGFEN